jgi:hypothetical protein
LLHFDFESTSPMKFIASIQKIINRRTRQKLKFEILKLEFFKRIA